MKKTIRNYPLSFILGGVILSFILIIILFPSLFTNKSPYTIQQIKFFTSDGVLDAASAPFPPSSDSIMGTDDLGRDIFSFIIYGTRLTVLLGLLISLGQFIVALPLSLYAGFKHQWARTIINQFNLVFSAIPALLINVIILQLTFFLGLDKTRSIIAFVIILTFTGWAKLAVLITDRVDTINKQSFITGEIAIGKTPLRIAIENVIPHLIPELIVLLFMEIARSLSMIMQLGIFGVFIGNLRIIESTDWGSISYYNVSFEPEWASMLGTSRTMITVAPWAVLFPALAFFISVFGFNLFGEGLREILQDKTSKVIPTTRKLLTMDFAYFKSGLKNRSFKQKSITAIVILSFIGLLLFSTRNAYPFMATTDMSSLPSRVVIGTDESLDTAHFIENAMIETGLTPLNSTTYISDYSVPESFIAQDTHCILTSNHDQRSLEINTDYAYSHATGNNHKGLVIDCTLEDIFTYDNYQNLTNNFVLVDSRYYTEMAINTFIQKTTSATEVQGFLIINDNPISIEQILINKNTDYNIINITQEVGDYIIGKEDVSLSLSSEVNPLQTRGHNVVGFYQGSDPFISDEAILIGMNYNYLDPDNRYILQFNLDLMKQLCKEGNRRSLIFMFYDGTLNDAYSGIHPLAGDMPYSSQKIKVYIDLTKIKTPTYDTLRFSTDQAPITRQFAWSIGHHLQEELDSAKISTTSPDVSNYNGSYYLDDYYSDNTMFWDRGIATIHIGTDPVSQRVSNDPVSQSQNTSDEINNQGQSETKDIHTLDELGSILLKVIDLNNY